MLLLLLLLLLLEPLCWFIGPLAAIKSAMMPLAALAADDGPAKERMDG